MSRKETTFEFHISRKARDKFRFDETFFSITGDVMLANPHAAQLFSVAINDQRKKDKDKQREAALSASQLNAMGLFHEVLHFVIASYQRDANPAVFRKLENFLRELVGESELSGAENKFVDLFPPTSVYRGELRAIDFVSGTESGVPGQHRVLEELLLLWLQNRNPAFEAVAELIDEKPLAEVSAYRDVLSGSNSFFDTQPGYGPTDSPLIKMLLAPIEASPDSITGQLQFMADNWQDILADSPFLRRILGAIDFAKEEGKYFMMLAQAQADRARMPEVRQRGFEWGGERGAQPVLNFRGTGAEYEAENFSTDLSWMPRLVLIAKNAFVWLDQLSKKYGRWIGRLDQIPDEELEVLAKRGFTGLWLIGIWKRSAASQRIKHLNGNPDAIASAYSLDSYDIADELGGEDGYANLRDRAWRYGIRLASDMVPNHMGLDSSWVMNHPDWFLSSQYEPYPNYTFTGPDLSWDERVGIFLEDGYWSKRDAAVAFKRLDRWTGDARYIYHGNDGTHMPWNDTAQLDFTKPEVREAVIQTILHVARKFPIIRFDAAMVLSKKHYQRLWFPEPGTGGAIPSRSNFSMTKDEFDSAIPVEFWREVVDRIQKEAPDTLLLAEAFWLMEGYFVRTLGMHRVYNSAFMNMLKREENSNYRQVIKNILEYNPQILKRFVNFMNNPDEETAIAQFGKDDKYFGVCVLMSTMPGLPMYGHGQVEGLTEKYGMEFKRAYRDESEDEYLVARHEREIFPLLKIRSRFSEVENFLLYDFFTGNGNVNEDVFAYSNGTGDERNLVVYNNRYTHTAGWIKTSVGFRDAGGNLVRRSLADGLSLRSRKNAYCIFRDAISNVEYIRPIKTISHEGLFVELGAYKYSVFMDFREVHATAELPYDELDRLLDGRGVASIEDELFSMKLREVHGAFYEAINRGSMEYLADHGKSGRITSTRLDAFDEKAEKLRLSILAYHHHPAPKSKPDDSNLRDLYRAFQVLPGHAKTLRLPSGLKKLLSVKSANMSEGVRFTFLYLFLKVMAKTSEVSLKKNGVNPVDDYRLRSHIRNCLAEMEVSQEAADYQGELAGVLASSSIHFTGSELADPQAPFRELLEQEQVRRFVGFHEFEGTLWFNKERFEDLVDHWVLTAVAEWFAGNLKTGVKLLTGRLRGYASAGTELKEIASECGYDFTKLTKQLSPKS